MKKIIFLCMAVLGISTYTLAQSTDKYDTVKIKTSAVCDMCKETLEKAMAYEKGVKSSKLEVKAKELTVVYRPDKTSPEQIRRAVSMSGYDADDIPADPKAYERLASCCKKGSYMDKN